MQILLYTHTFWPNIGGVEDLAHVLAKGWTNMGHTVTVVTPTRADHERKSNYSVVRNPPFKDLVSLVRSHDLVFANGTSMRLFPIAWTLQKPFIWSHHGYQLICLDGAGWANGQPAPLTPWASFRHHLKLFGLRPALSGGFKLCLRRLVAAMANANVATSKHVATRQPLPRQRIIYNPIDEDLFIKTSSADAKHNLAEARATFTFVGRLITEKGVNDLLYALHDLKKRETAATGVATLRIIGDGPEKESLMRLAENLNLSSCINWERYTSDQLKQALVKAGICIIPSAWEEPGALIVLELLAMGKPLIVAQRGWLTECTGDACLSFPNGDRTALAKAMENLRDNRDLQFRLIDQSLARIKEFDSQASLHSYIDLFSDVLKRGN
jgi:glycosyltransferase involved in cell wall biosynthesis